MHDSGFGRIMHIMQTMHFMQVMQIMQNMQGYKTMQIMHFMQGGQEPGVSGWAVVWYDR